MMKTYDLEKNGMYKAMKLISMQQFIPKILHKIYWSIKLKSVFKLTMSTSWTLMCWTTSPGPIDKSQAWDFFDGAPQSHGCGGGFILYISEKNSFKVQMGLGEGTNNYAELITLIHLLHFALAHDCTTIQLFGDSKININCFNNKNHCHAISLRNIFDEVIIFKAVFNTISCHHIYGEYNKSANRLSLEATLLPRGLWMITK